MSTRLQINTNHFFLTLTMLHVADSAIVPKIIYVKKLFRKRKLILHLCFSNGPLTFLNVENSQFFIPHIINNLEQNITAVMLKLHKNH